MNPIILSQPIDAISIEVQQASVDHRDSILALAAPVAEVKTQDQLELANKVLSSLAGILKETEEARKQVKAPVLAIGKKIDDAAYEFVSFVDRESKRLKGLVNHFQTLQLREKEEREREARAAAAKAEREAAEAQRKIDAAKNEDAKLDAQLALERANLNQQSAEAQLSVPTNTPRGMTTRVRNDFQILNPAMAYCEATQQWWNWIQDEECIKFNRAGFLKHINSTECADEWKPSDGWVERRSYGIRIYRSVRVSVRG